MEGRTKHPGGRPLKFASVEELQTRIDEYFDSCRKANLKPFITELALWLDTSRETLANYEDRPEFFDTIKRAKLRCEVELERHLLNAPNVTGAIFNLKNNYGWVDRQETDLTTKGKELPTPIYGGNSVSRHDSDQEDIPAS